MRHLFTVLSFLTLLLAFSCKDKNAESSLLNTRWMLVQVENFPIMASSYSGAHRSYIEFTGGVDRTTGLGPCNDFGGTFSLGKEPGLLTISQQASTRATCPAIGIETKYLEALPRTVSYQIEGRKLYLYDASNTTKPLLIFEDRSSEE